MARKAFTEHPEFMAAGQTANNALATALEAMGLELRDLNSLDVHANRVVDEFTRLLLRAHDAKLAREQKSAA